MKSLGNHLQHSKIVDLEKIFSLLRNGIRTKKLQVIFLVIIIFLLRETKINNEIDCFFPLYNVNEHISLASI